MYCMWMATGPVWMSCNLTESVVCHMPRQRLCNCAVGRQNYTTVT